MEYGVDLSQREFDKKFMQVSGIRIIYDTRRKLGSKIVDFKVRCSSCEVPAYQPLQLDKQYNVTTTIDLLEIDYSILSSNVSKVANIDGTNWEAIKKYIRKKKVICPGNSDRITQLPLISSSKLVIVDEAVIIIAIIFLILHCNIL